MRFSMRIPAALAVLLLCFPGCKPKADVADEPGSGAPAVKSSLISPLSDGEARREGEALVAKYADNISGMFTDFITADGVTAKMKTYLLYQKLPQKEQANIYASLPTAIEKMADRYNPSTVTGLQYAGCRHDADKTRLVIRVHMANEGIEYIVYLAGKTADGEVLVEEPFLPMMNETLSQSLASTLIASLEAMTPVSKLRMILSPSEAEEVRKKQDALIQLGRAVRTENYPEVIRLYETHDVGRWNIPAMDIQYIAAMAATVDENTPPDSPVLEKIDRATHAFSGKYPRSIACDMFMIDVHYLRNNLAGTEACIRSVADKLIDDPYLTEYLLGALYMETDPEKSLKLFRQAKTRGLVYPDFYANYLYVLLDRPELKDEFDEVYALFTEHYGEEDAEATLENILQLKAENY